VFDISGQHAASVYNDHTDIVGCFSVWVREASVDSQLHPSD
jgi:hypothetical protein